MKVVIAPQFNRLHLATFLNLSRSGARKLTDALFLNQYDRPETINVSTVRK